MKSKRELFEEADHIIREKNERLERLEKEAKEKQEEKKRRAAERLASLNLDWLESHIVQELVRGNRTTNCFLQCFPFEAAAKMRKVLEDAGFTCEITEALNGEEIPMYDGYHWVVTIYLDRPPKTVVS